MQMHAFEKVSEESLECSGKIISFQEWVDVVGLRSWKLSNLEKYKIIRNHPEPNRNRWYRSGFRFQMTTLLDRTGNTIINIAYLFNFYFLKKEKSEIPKLN